MDVDLVGIQHRLVHARARFKRADPAQNSLARVARPRAEHDGLRDTKACAEASERAPHRAYGNARPAFTTHLQAQELARPGRARPAEGLGRATKKRGDACTKRVVDLWRSVVPPLVEQAVDALLREAGRGAHHRRARDVERFGHRRASLATRQPRDHVEPHGCIRVSAPPTDAHQLAPLVAAHPGYIVHTRVLSSWVFGNSQTEKGPRVFPSISLSDRASCSVI